MPTYQYRCNACKHSFEEFQRMTADALVDCPACKEPSLKRLIGAGGGVIFKGSGFYVNDYGRGGNNPRSADKARSEASSSTSTSDSGSTATSAEKSCGSCDSTGPSVCDPA